jgi:hypothetical protein
MATVSNVSIQSGSDIDDSGAVEQCKYSTRYSAYTFCLACSYMSEDYKQMLLKALRCIDSNPPSLISSGSSGSYFIHGDQNVSILN